MAVLVLALALAGCSVEENTFTSRAYHNLTARYNVYFNGREAFKSGLRQMQQQHRDNFAAVLPLFLYENEQTRASASADMLTVQEKAIKLVQKHSITDRPNRRRKRRTDRNKAFNARIEYCNWVDEAYLLMGKAYFHQGKHEEALKALRFLIQNFELEPARYEAELWVARALAESDDLRGARNQLDLILLDRDFPEELKGQVALLYADYHLKKKEYEQAVPQLEQAIASLEDKRFVLGKRRQLARYKFVLAQCYTELGRHRDAARTYEEVEDLNPPYELVFNAKINRAKSFDVSSGGSEAIRRELEKMLKDDKNIDYLDQIYYTLADIALREGRRDEAMNYYRLSAAKSVNNPSQKSLTHLALADLYYAQPDYVMAQAYYDSCVANLFDGHPEYENIQRKAEFLTELVSSARTIAREDSLRALAALSPDRQRQHVERMIQDLRNQEAREQQASQPSFDPNFDNPTNAFTPPGGGGGGSDWYFYNPTSVSFGTNEFKRKWGDRPLQDHWRRSNRQASAAGDPTDEQADSLDKYAPEFYLRDIPNSDSALAASQTRIVAAYLAIAQVYLEKLGEPRMAISYLEELNRRFPDHDQRLEALYRLYLCHYQANDAAGADRYKGLIIQEFPESHYAKLFTNPRYFEELEAASRAAEAQYAQAYALLEAGQPQPCLALCEQVVAQHPDLPLVPNFLYLKALALGQIDAPQVVRCREVLRLIMAEHSQSPVYPKAQAMLQAIDQGSRDDVYLGVSEILYQMEEAGFNRRHFVLLIPRGDTDMGSARLRLSNYNRDNYGPNVYQTQLVPLGAQEIVVIKEFPDDSQALVYLSTLRGKVSTLEGLEDAEFRFFVISEPNFAKFVQDRDVLKYERYHNAHYSTP